MGRLKEFFERVSSGGQTTGQGETTNPKAQDKAHANAGYSKGEVSSGASFSGETHTVYKEKGGGGNAGGGGKPEKDWASKV